MHLDRNKIKINNILRVSPSNKKNTVPQKKTYKQPIIRQHKDNNYAKKLIRSTKIAEVKATRQVYDSYRYKSLRECYNILEGEPAFLLGNAPSMVNHDFNLIQDYFSIGINRIFYLFEPTILLWQDIEMWKHHRRDIFKCKSIRISRDNSDPHNMFLNFKLKYNPPRFTDDPSVLYGRGNSGMLAAQLAYAFGCSSLIILGMDCKYEKDRTNFYGKNKDHKPYTLKMCRGAIEWIKKECPLPIYNCSDNQLWERISLEDAIKKSNPTPKGKKYFLELFKKE